MRPTLCCGSVASQVLPYVGFASNLIRALVAMANDDMTVAIQLFDKLLSLDDGNIEAISNRALCLLYDHKLMQAIEVCCESLICF